MQEAISDLTQKGAAAPVRRTRESKAARSKYHEQRGIELEARKKEADTKKASIMAKMSGGGSGGGGMKYTALAMAGALGKQDSLSRPAEGSEY